MWFGDSILIMFKGRYYSANNHRVAKEGQGSSKSTIRVIEVLDDF